MKYRFISDNQSEFSVEQMCEVFDLQRSGYYAWKQRSPSQRCIEDQERKRSIQRIHSKAKGRYGHRPIHEHLKDEGLQCGRDRTLRLMKELGLEGVQRKRFKPSCTDSRHCFGYADNLIKKLGQPTGLDQIWVADTTYLKTDGGWNYLATVMDLFSRRIIGWSVSDRNDCSLVCQALKAALLTRGNAVMEKLVHHSDRGSTYASYQYQNLLESRNIAQSMSAKGNCYDNAAMESFFGRYKSSSVRGRVFENQDQVRSNVFEYIEIFYNRFRKHASLNYQSPMQVENFSCPHGGMTSGEPTCLASN